MHAGAVVKEEYGKWDSSCCTFEKLEEIKAWLLNPDSCPTRWQRLLDIRRSTRLSRPPHHRCPGVEPGARAGGGRRGGRGGGHELHAPLGGQGDARLEVALERLERG